MIGATITPTGTPAFASRSIAARRSFGGAARGSRIRWSDASRLVTEIATDAAPWEASSARRSTSRVTVKLFVMTATGFRYSASTSSTPRVMPSFRSAGWYASVTPESAIVAGFQRGESSAFRSKAGASCFTRIFVSKSRPADQPRYSCEGRA
jgi:hypothetical protein